MGSAREQMQTLKAELERIQTDIAKLKVEEALLIRMLGKLGDKEAKPEKRPRSPAVKPVVLDFMTEVGERGATTAEVDDRVRDVVPSVAKDTVGSILSRLKGDGALTYLGERYYIKGKEPKDDETRSLALRMIK